MEASEKARSILEQLGEKSTKLGDIRKLAKEIKKDHVLALELWGSKLFFPRQLTLLIMDKKLLSEESIDVLIQDIESHEEKEKLHLMDWFMANQLLKDKRWVALIEGWRGSSEALKKRTYWYHQARLRWMGKIQSNSADLLETAEKNIENETDEVQWAMNFTVGWIGVFEKDFRDQCVQLGERTGLYQGQMVAKGCTPDYLPEFIAIESKKRGL